MGLLEGKVAVVTGSGNGIGRGIALLMAEEGAKVVVNDIGGKVDGSGESSTAAERVVREIKERGGEAVPNFDSIATSEGANRIIATAVDTYGKIDVLVNNAGILRDRMLWNMSDEEWDAVMKVHLYGYFYCTRAAVTWMRNAIREGNLPNGRVINFTSGAGFRGMAGQPNYSAAKMGVIGFTYSTANACAKLGITCNAVAPKALTRMSDTIPDDQVRQLAKWRGYAGWNDPDVRVAKKAIFGGEPEGVAPLVVWLASDEAQHVNGEVLLSGEGQIGIYSHIDDHKFAYKNGRYTVAEVSQLMRAIAPPPAQQG